MSRSALCAALLASCAPADSYEPCLDCGDPWGRSVAFSADGARQLGWTVQFDQGGGLFEVDLLEDYGAIPCDSSTWPHLGVDLFVNIGGDDRVAAWLRGWPLAWCGVEPGPVVVPQLPGIHLPVVFGGVWAVPDHVSAGDVVELLEGEGDLVLGM